jgi:Tfp pilus assembly protein PilZ
MQRHIDSNAPRRRKVGVSSARARPRAVDAECRTHRRGLFVKIHKRRPDAGTPVSLLLQFDGVDKEVLVQGIVRWQGAVRSLEDGTEGAGMGIQFTEMEPPAREVLEQTLGEIEGH